MPALQNLDVEHVSLVDRAAVRDSTNKTEPMRFLLFKRDGITGLQGGSMTEAEMRAAVEKAETERDELRKQLEDQTDLKAKLTKAEADLATASTERDTAKAELEKAVKPEPGKTQIDKSDLAPAVREALEKAEERAEEAEKVAKAERDERLTRDFIAKAESYQALPVEAAKFGPVLKSASEHLSKDEFEALETVLKSADEQIQKGDLFKEQGRSGEAQAPKGAVAELQAKAEEIRKNDPKVPLAKAMDLAMDADPELQTRYLAEVRG